MDYFKDKIALVTGGASGMGRAVCEQMGRHGATLVVADINHDGAQEVAGSILAAGGQAQAVNLDVTRRKDVHDLVNRIAREHEAPTAFALLLEERANPCVYELEGRLLAQALAVLGVQDHHASAERYRRGRKVTDGEFDVLRDARILRVPPRRIQRCPADIGRDDSRVERFVGSRRSLEHLGSDRVFDVIGEVLVGKSLKDLIADAIANRRTMDDILKDFERIPDEVAIQKVKEASLEALATRHIDLTRIMGEQRRAKENKLVPEYIEAFFKRTANPLNIEMKQLPDGFWHITSIPFEVRNQPYAFKTKFSEVQREYSKVSFDKDKAFKGQAEFVSMGHPLLEGCIENIFARYSQTAGEGATFIDPEGRRDGVIWFCEAEIKDGSNSIPLIPKVKTRLPATDGVDFGPLPCPVAAPFIV